jgi:hypothetical protein
VADEAATRATLAASLTGRTGPLLRSVMTLAPVVALKKNTSSPSPPVRASLPWPAQRCSSPAPPSMPSLPSPPKSCHRRGSRECCLCPCHQRGCRCPGPAGYFKFRYGQASSSTRGAGQKWIFSLTLFPGKGFSGLFEAIGASLELKEMAMTHQPIEYCPAHGVVSQICPQSCTTRLEVTTTLRRGL